MRIAVEDMAPGQLKLEYASCCQWHGANSLKALALAGGMDVEALREALVLYHAAKAKEDWQAAEDALLGPLPDHLKD